jgi:branched-subunit amino acid transport protein
MEREIKDFLAVLLLSGGVTYTIRRLPLITDYLCDRIEPVMKRFNERYHENHPDESI